MKLLSMSNPAPTYDQFIAGYPVFASLPEAMVTNQINDSAQMQDSGSWGQFYALAVSLDAAHNLVLDAMATGGVTAAFQASIGQMTSATGPGVSASFSGPRQGQKGYAESFYSSTSYGKKFLMLQNRVINCVGGTGDLGPGYNVDDGLDMPLLP